MGAALNKKKIKIKKRPIACARGLSREICLYPSDCCKFAVESTHLSLALSADSSLPSQQQLCVFLLRVNPPPRRPAFTRMTQFIRRSARTVDGSN